MVYLKQIGRQYDDGCGEGGRARGFAIQFKKVDQI